ncbi:MAG: cytochrome b/b6 domain-containing protein [Halieaceae bacterium]|nr:cytochrome b/b6 domain-containing protein [Halieaceae bacterium]
MTQTRGFSRRAIIMHWLITISIFFLFISSWWMLSLPFPSEDFKYRVLPFQVHKNIGITILFFLAILLYLRFKFPPGTVVISHAHPWMSRLVIFYHFLLYVIILSCCVSGYMSSSYSGWNTTLWWIIELPNWGYEDEELNIFYSEIHLWTCWALLVLVAIHVSGAIYHAFRNDGIVQRMLRL